MSYLKAQNAHIIKCFWSSIRLLMLLSVIMHGSMGTVEAYNVKDESAETWKKLAKDDIAAAIKDDVDKEAVAKNVLFFLGDGMGISTVTAARIYKGQLEGNPGEEGWLSFDRFKHLALVKTYNTDSQVPDSAATATAYLCGVKARIGTIGVNQNVEPHNCSSYSSSQNVYSIAHYAHLTGKSIGLVTTTRITHATPAGIYAHTPYRDWEDDTARNKEVINSRGQCPDIADQLISNARDYQVVLGGGLSNFIPSSEIDYFGKKGKRSDGRDLIKEWKTYQDQQKRKAVFVYDKKELMEESLTSDYMFGLFASSHLNYEDERGSTSQPSISEMTEAAIRVLSRNPKGFFLLVEGGRIDHAHHDNQARLALSDTVAFDKAISKALDMTNVKDTLTVVTADHSHVFTIGTYPSRGNNILGITDSREENTNLAAGLAKDKLPHTTLGYYNGPSATNGQPRVNISAQDTTTTQFRQPSLVPLGSESHGGEDIAVYAQGPGAWLFHRTHEQSYVAHVVMYASCVGDYRYERRCPNSSEIKKPSFLLMMTLAAILIIKFKSEDIY